MAITSYRDLDVWQYSMELAKRVYVASEMLPWPHRHELGRQMRRASMSAPSNVAEGFRQGSVRAYVHHVRIAAGSTAELETQVQLTTDLRLWTPDVGEEIGAMADRSGRMLTGLIRSLELRVKEGRVLKRPAR